MIALPIAPIDGLALSPTLPPTLPPHMARIPATGGFADLLASGIEATNAKLIDADKMVRAFALDDAIPVHQVTYAIAQARLSLELMLQVRGRLIEGYQQLMNMPL